jgi:hypothetical protein
VADGLVDGVCARHHVARKVISLGGLGLPHRIDHRAAQEASAKTRFEGHAAQAFFCFRGLWLLPESALGFAREDRRRELS